MGASFSYRILRFIHSAMKTYTCSYFTFCLLFLVLGYKVEGIIWPPGGSKVQVICGFGVPVDLKRETVIFGTVYKANYALPTNISQLESGFPTIDRKKRSYSRWNMYNALSQAIEMRGYRGKSCILRTICEVARIPLEKTHGLFDELIHLFFTPTETMEQVELNSDNEYYAAEMAGKKDENCEKVFNDCDMNLVEMFTEMY